MSTLSRKKFDERFVEAKYRSLIATPFSTPTALPADADFAVQSTAGNVANATALSYTGYNGRTIRVPALDAGEIYRIGRIQRAAVVTVSAGFDLLVDIGLGRLVKVGEN